MGRPIDEWAVLTYGSEQGHYARGQSNSRVVEYFLKLHQNTSEQLPHIALETLFYSTTFQSRGKSLFLDTHAVAYFGLGAYVATLVNDKNWNKKDITGRTPLAVAATEGYGTMVWILMERKDVDVNSKDTEDDPPLTRAAHRGHEAIV